MASSIKFLSSMATKQVLLDLVAEYAKSSTQAIDCEATGGVKAAERVRAGEAFDIVCLASNVIDKLIAEGHLLPGSRVDLVRSGVAIAVHADAPAVDVGSEEAVKQAVLAAPTIGYSTGPSGVYLGELFERWGIAGQIKDRIVQAPPGVPVGQFVADGQVALGFQQLAELMNQPGIRVLGPLPDAIQTITTFSAGLGKLTTQLHAARAVLDFMASDAATKIKQANGMDAA